MKKTILILLVSAVLFISCSPNKMGASVATVGNNAWKVTLYHYSKDVVISENGVECEKVSALAGFKKPGYASYETGSAGTPTPVRRRRRGRR